MEKYIKTTWIVLVKRNSGVDTSFARTNIKIDVAS